MRQGYPGANQTYPSQACDIDAPRDNQRIRTMSQITSEIASLNAQLDARTGKGEILEALGEFYAEDCTFQEGNGEARVGRATQHEHLSGFFSTLKAFNGATLHASGVGDNVTLSEWTFDMEGPDGPILWNEILVRRWNGGKVVSERFYTA
jgi:ketosteroid isomerase-like protein